ncbi:hypothetical protein OAS41_02465 [Candidatus Marinimicrobia bacterium]|nr:hypothetical protein [Candidatus Neomarinimicrobiota bacterium]MDC0521636.1 hypothetical protein [Candidatus Neomarinimicrobiota bacterium]MDC0593947.1 hypothetical protein [Candidatus Neomarinimicrobiota bacterium]MDC0878132.1 hypothetical protein [Candidatus Neomarinimicrobiota bacterium]MDC1000755.1 hypothetical protein [Candidatus Neomarinimicrobiota bacterium]|tara:strand:+ start:129 stop:731 length:603 start_codon:yes stop_codon:yes gene_type:complete
MKKCIILLAIFLSLLQAHPVVFKGGKVIWLIDSPNITEIRFGKTFTKKFYSGVRVFNDKYIDQSYIASNNNLLVKRWNASNYQANIYALSSIGLNIDSEKSMYNLGLHTDWENRRFMVMHMIEYSSFNESTKNSVRLAFTPKITDYKGTAVWLIGQYTNYSFDDKNNEMLMPVIRILKRNYLLEFGGNGNETFLTLMTHF